MILSIVIGGLYLAYALSVISINNKLAKQIGKKKCLDFAAMLLLLAVAVTVMFVWGVMRSNDGLIVLLVLVPLVLPLGWLLLFLKQQCEILTALRRVPMPTSNVFALGFFMFVPVYSFYVLCENYNAGVDAFTRLTSGH